MTSDEQTQATILFSLAAIRHLRRFRLAPYDPARFSRADLEAVGRLLLDNADRWFAERIESTTASEASPGGAEETPQNFRRRVPTSRFIL